MLIGEVRGLALESFLKTRNMRGPPETHVQTINILDRIGQLFATGGRSHEQFDPPI